MNKNIQALKRVFQSPFYWFIAVDGALGLGLLYWWLLSKTTTAVVFYSMYREVPFYLWIYIILTLASLVLFGMVLFARPIGQSKFTRSPALFASIFIGSDDALVKRANSFSFIPRSL